MRRRWSSSSCCVGPNKAAELLNHCVGQECCYPHTQTFVSFFSWSKIHQCGGPEICFTPSLARARKTRITMYVHAATSELDAAAGVQPNRAVEIQHVSGWISRNLSQHWRGFNSDQRQTNQDLRADMRPPASDQVWRKTQIITAHGHAATRKDIRSPARPRWPAENVRWKTATHENSTWHPNFCLTPLSTIPAMLSSDLSRAGYLPSHSQLTSASFCGPVPVALEFDTSCARNVVWSERP